MTGYAWKLTGGTTAMLMIATLALVLAVSGGETALAAPAGDAHGAAGHEKPALISDWLAGIMPAITTLVVFAILLAVLGKFAWAPILSGLKQREDKIRQDIADAEAARGKAEATLREYRKQLDEAEAKIRQMMADATTDAERAATNIRMKGEQEAMEIRERANRDIASARDQAIAEIYTQAAELGTGIAEKILRRNINVDDQRALVQESLQQLQTVKA